MKNKLLLGAVLVGTAGIFAACSDDNDSNPTLIQPTTHGDYHRMTVLVHDSRVIDHKEYAESHDAQGQQQCAEYGHQYQEYVTVAAYLPEFR